MGEDRPFYGLESPAPGSVEREPASIEEMAALYVEEIRKIQPEGPYQIGGWSVGAAVAVEIAQQLQSQGQTLGLLALIDRDVPLGPAPERADFTPLLARFALDLCQMTGIDPGRFQERFLQLDEQGQYQLMMEELQVRGFLPKDQKAAERRMKDFYEMFARNSRAAFEYRMRPLAQEILLLLSEHGGFTAETGRQWEEWTAGVEMHVIPGDHYTMMQPPNVGVLAEWLQKRLGESAAARTSVLAANERE
jgi:thioesterase domain-containing protein